MSSGATSFCFAAALVRIGLAAEDLRAGAGLLLGGMPALAFEGFTGLESKAGPFNGVFPYSANFQKGAGELVGICWLGLCAVLGGASRG